MQKKFKILFLIFVLGLAGFTFYKFYPNFSLLSSNEKVPEQAIDIVKAGDQRGLLKKSPKFAKIGALAPDFITEDVYGNKIVLSSFRNKKPVLLVFWATW